MFEPEFVLNIECAPGLVIVSLLNVTAKPPAPSSFTPLIVDPSTEINGSCVV